MFQIYFSRNCGFASEQLSACCKHLFLKSGFLRSHKLTFAQISFQKNRFAIAQLFYWLKSVDLYTCFCDFTFYLLLHNVFLYNCLVCDYTGCLLLRISLFSESFQNILCDRQFICSLSFCSLTIITLRFLRLSVASFVSLGVFVFAFPQSNCCFSCCFFQKSFYGIPQFIYCLAWFQLKNNKFTIRQFIQCFGFLCFQ